jgi:hypothetical protein
MPVERLIPCPECPPQRERIAALPASALVTTFVVIVVMRIATSLGGDEAAAEHAPIPLLVSQC